MSIIECRLQAVISRLTIGCEIKLFLQLYCLRSGSLAIPAIGVLITAKDLVTTCLPPSSYLTGRSHLICKPYTLCLQADLLADILGVLSVLTIDCELTTVCIPVSFAAFWKF